MFQSDCEERRARRQRGFHRWEFVELPARVKREGKLRESVFTDDAGSSSFLFRGLFISLVDRVDVGRRANVEYGKR